MDVVATHNASAALRAVVDAHPNPPGRHGGSARAALERRTVHFTDAQADPEYTYGLGVYDDPVHTVLAVPMLRADELLGVIFIYRHEVRSFTDGQIALLETFADQAAWSNSVHAREAPGLRRGAERGVYGGPIGAPHDG
jgi:GAF domain-containing protein